MSVSPPSSTVEGATFMEDDDPHSHLQIVITAPVKSTDIVLYVNLTSYDASQPPGDRNDPACLVYPGEHPFILHDTCVCYAKAQFLTLGGFEIGIRAGHFLPWGEPADATMLDKIRRCSGDSKFMEIGPYRILENLLLV